MSDTRHPFSRPTPAHTCPHCGSAAVTSVGRVLADITGIRREYRCGYCSQAFFRPADTLASTSLGRVEVSSPNTEASMTNAEPWHSTSAPDRLVYHDDTRCSEGGRIELPDRRPGAGGRPLCAICAANRP